MIRTTSTGNARKQRVPRGDLTEEIQMQTSTNSRVEFNLGVFNVPTIALCLTIIGMLVSQTSNRTKIDTKVELRLDAIETSRAAAKVENAAILTQMRSDANSQFAEINAKLARLDGLEFKVEANTQQISAANDRADRQSDAIGKMSQGISDISSDLKLLTQRLEIAVPLKKTEFLPILPVPSELATTK